MKVVTADEMRAVEDRSEEAGVSTDTLMENAGLAVARTARRMVEPLAGVSVVVLVGPGNNGADGLVTARHLRRWGARVTAYICRERGTPDPKLDDARGDGVDVVSVLDDPGLDRLRRLLDSAHLVIDAILGTGRARPVEGTFRDILCTLSATRGNPRGPKLLALDLPTGLNCDTADVDPACVASDVTVALGCPKRGHLAFPGADYVGCLEVADIGIPSGLDDDVQVDLLTSEWARTRLPERPGDSHKGTFGRTMIVAGSRSFLGATYLAAASAARVGAGLVTIAIPSSLVSSVAPRAVEPTFLPLPESSDGVVAPDAADLILEALGGYSALLVGCGLGQADQTRAMVERLLLSATVDLPATVVDADGLNTLARIPGWHDRWSANAVLTPHPGEMARLVDSSNSSESINQQIPSPLRERSRACPVLDTGVKVLSRLDIAKAAAGEWSKTVVLKGAYTVVAHADGLARVAPFSNPGLATAGTGDVLAGAIAGLLSQGLEPETAASLGVYLHGLAGDSVRDRLGDTGMIASDLLSELPTVIRDLR